METHPEGKPNYLLCKCRSHDCGAQTWQATRRDNKAGHKLLMLMMKARETVLAAKTAMKTSNCLMLAA
jgi:hypothetical protein